MLASLLVAALILAAQPVQPGQIEPFGTKRVVVALENLDGGTILYATDPDLTTHVESQIIDPADIQPGALRDIHTCENVHLLTDVVAGQQITNFTEEHLEGTTPDCMPEGRYSSTI